MICQLFLICTLERVQLSSISEKINVLCVCVCISLYDGITTVVTITIAKMRSDPRINIVLKINATEFVRVSM